ncbi:unnamed protein product [Dovyalis caffra]|uniref:Uncharacterized protein n=1 Tax=Dovyalis caffra TaxID=77055 RepID=A0AAV1S544_9ROSI|nr:unnamed protein product [Dovyalis caffra]
MPAPYKQEKMTNLRVQKDGIAPYETGRRHRTPSISRSTHLIVKAGGPQLRESLKNGKIFSREDLFVIESTSGSSEKMSCWWNVPKDKKSMLEVHVITNGIA